LLTQWIGGYIPVFSLKANPNEAFSLFPVSADPFLDIPFSSSRILTLATVFSPHSCNLPGQQQDQLMDGFGLPAGSSSTFGSLDPAFAVRDIILADKRDGKPLDSKEGPFRIVSPGDKRAAR
jgi:hypothetical protein